jgi:MmyB-like transcription regulator ligand binding domain/Mycothiol maleylpyruvate isomerase N-terminal domain
VNEFASAESALVALGGVVRTIGDDDLHRPTPCRDWDVAALSDHLLQLDDDASNYLRAVARPAPRRRGRSASERCDPAVHLFAPGQNILRAAFLEPEMRMLYRDWDRFTTRIVPFLRAVLGAEQPDRELLELIGELSIAGKRFATLWARHDVKHRSTGPTAFYHPQVGPLDLHYAILHLPDQRQMIITYHADPGSPSEENLRLLASLAT